MKINFKNVLAITIGTTLLITPFYTSNIQASDANKVETLKCYTAKDNKDTIIFKKNKLTSEPDFIFGFGHKSKLKDYDPSIGVSVGSDTSISTDMISGVAYMESTSVSVPVSDEDEETHSSGYRSDDLPKFGCENILVKIGSKDIATIGYEYEKDPLKVEPYFNKDVAMIPIDALKIFITDNGTKWDAKTSEVSFTDTVGNKVILKINSDKAKINGKNVTLSKPVIIKNKTTMIPITLLNQYLGAKVSYYSEYKAFEIANKSTVRYGETYGPGSNINEANKQAYINKQARLENKSSK